MISDELGKRCNFPVSILHVSEDHALVIMIRNRSTLYGKRVNIAPKGYYDVENEYQCVNKQLCGICGLYSSYDVWSYKTCILQQCMECEHCKFDTKWYSNNTRNLQKIITWALPELERKLEIEIELEAERRKEVRKAIKKGIIQLWDKDSKLDNAKIERLYYYYIEGGNTDENK